MIPFEAVTKIIWLAQATPTTIDGLPVALTGGGIITVLAWVIWRADKRVIALEARLDAERSDANRRVDAAQADATRRMEAADERYRAMTDKYSERTFTVAAEVAKVSEIVRTLADERDARGRAG